MALFLDQRYKQFLGAHLGDDYNKLCEGILEIDIVWRQTGEDSKRNSKAPNSEGASALNANGEPGKHGKFRKDGSRIRQGQCHHCGIQGHFLKECKVRLVGKPQTEKGKEAVEKWKKMKNKNKGDNQPYSNSCCNSFDSYLFSNHLIVNSGANPTQIPPSELIENKFKDTRETSMVDGTKSITREQGNIWLFKDQSLLMVMINESFKKGLLSVYQVVKEFGQSVVFNRGKVRFIEGELDIDENRIKGTGYVNGGLYMFNPADPKGLKDVAQISADFSHNIPGLERIQSGETPRNLEFLKGEKKVEM